MNGGLSMATCDIGFLPLQPAISKMDISMLFSFIIVAGFMRHLIKRQQLHSLRIGEVRVYNILHNTIVL